jgi:RND family efflux transporter MFP subunit
MPAKRIIIALIVVLIGGWFVWVLVERVREAKRTAVRDEATAAPVEVAAVERGSIELRRVFSGTLQSRVQFVVAPKISGRIERISVDLADPVSRGQVVAELDDDEYVQAVTQVEAELAVANANLAEAISTLEIATRELERVQSLTEQGIGSESELDAAKSNQLAKQAAVKVAEAQMTRAEAALSTARIRLGYTRIQATWTGDDARRLVAQRHVEEGDTVAANAPLLTIVELDPITAVIHLTGRDYGRVQAGQPVTLTTDAYPSLTFTGRVERVAPVFREASRQARAELTIANPEHRLKPGMFVRAEAVLDRAEDALIVPLAALVTRGGQEGLFVLNPEGTAVSWRPVQVGIMQETRVQVIGNGLGGRVVTLGQQLLDDGSLITIPEARSSGQVAGAGA